MMHPSQFSTIRGRAERFRHLILLMAGAAMLGGTASGAVVFAETFDDDATAEWAVNSGGGTNVADFFFDYSSVGIPSAPNSGGTTRGLRLQANVAGDLFTGLSVSPTGLSVAGDFVLTFDMWLNYNGPLSAGGAGSTQITGAGFGTSGGVAVWQGAPIDEAVFFSLTGDGGSLVDYRVYFPNPNANGFTLAPDQSPIYSAAGDDNRNSAHPYYSVFGGVPAPAAQVAAFPGQTGQTPAGSAAFAWREVTIARAGDVVSWTIDGRPYAELTLDATTGPLGGGNILFMQADINNSSSTDPAARDLLFGLIDNVRVEAVPEPSAAVLLPVAALLAARSRRRPRRELKNC